MKNPTLSTLILCVNLAFLPLLIQAQEQIGFHTDNYAGINSVQLNPAGYANTPFSWDVNLGELGFFFENNYLYLKPFRLLDAPSTDFENIYYIPDLKDPSEAPAGALITDFYNDNRKRFANVTYNILGPSFYAYLGESNAIGLTTRVRFMATGSGITNNLSYYPYFSQAFFESFEVPKFSLGAMAWSELGLNFMHKIEMDGGELAIGITAKYLTGFEAAYLYNEKSFQLTKLPGDTLSSDAVSLNFGFTNSNIATTDNTLAQNGTGVGFDLGFVYTAKDYDDGYEWKIGFSILDIGKIKFTENAQQHLVNTDQVTNLATAGFNDISGTDEFESKIQYFSEQLLNDSSLSLKNSEFSMWLPSAISVQAEYSFTPNLFVNAALVQGIALGGIGVRRGSVFAVTPRFEKRWYGVSLPVSVYNWQDLRMGAAVRLAFFTFGSGNLGSIFRASEFSGTDFYMAVKFNPFSLGLRKNGRSKSRSRSRRSSLKGVKCYEF